MLVELIYERIRVLNPILRIITEQVKPSIQLLPCASSCILSMSNVNRNSSRSGRESGSWSWNGVVSWS